MQQSISYYTEWSYADPGFFSGEEEGGRVQARRPENSLDKFFLVFNLFYSLQRGSNGFITEKIILFLGGGGGGGQNANFYRNPYNL